MTMSTVAYGGSRRNGLLKPFSHTALLSALSIVMKRDGFTFP
jgi:hypothetical protein